MKFSPVDLEMRSYLQRIATGPELSKDLSEEETYHAMTHILAGSADEVQSAIFLIALRMKRETDPVSLFQRPRGELPSPSTRNIREFFVATTVEHPRRGPYPLPMGLPVVMSWICGAK